MRAAIHVVATLAALSLVASSAFADDTVLLQRMDRMEQTIRAQQDRIDQLERAESTNTPAVPVPTATASIQDRLRVNAFGGWGFGDSTNGNDYDRIAANGGDYENFDGGLTFALRASDALRLGAQIEGNEDNILLSWLFAEWRYSDAVRVRAGRSKQPFGLYSETLAIGTTRAFFNLPPSVYLMPDLAAESYDGLGATGDLALGEWGVRYDVYGGALDIHPDLNAGLAFLDTGLPQDQREHSLSLEAVRDVVGARVQFEPPFIEGLLVGIAGYRGKDPEGNLYRVGAQAQLDRGPFGLRSEYYHSASQDLSSDSAYAEGTYRVTEHWQLAGRVDWAHFDSPVDGAPNDLEEHLELAAGLNYWLDPGWVWRLSYHHIKGNLFASPPVIEDLTDVAAIDDQTDAIIFGTQFSF